MSFKKWFWVVVMALFWSVFFGITVFAIGIGALFPQINRIATPFVCPNGELDWDEQTYRPSPGTTVTTINWICTDATTGSKEVVEELKPNLIAGTIYGLIAFVFVMIFLFIWRSRAASRQPSAQKPNDLEMGQLASLEAARRNRPTESSFHLSKESGGETEIAKELRELKNLRDSELITEDDYQKKKAEILSRL
jgi:putative oligomerization/nucleic acid binding protein